MQSADQPFDKCPSAPADLPVDAVPLALGAAAEFHHCDTVFLRLQNRGPDPIDLTIAYLDGDYAIAVPKRAKTGPRAGIRLEPGQKPVVAGFSVAAWKSSEKLPAAVGRERLVLIGVLRRSEKDLATPAYFGEFLEQPGLSEAVSAVDAVAMRGSARRAQQRAAIASTRSVSGAADDLLAKVTGSTLLRAAGGGRVADLDQAFAIVLPWADEGRSVSGARAKPRDDALIDIFPLQAFG